MKLPIVLQLPLLLGFSAISARAQFQVDSLVLNDTEVTIQFTADAGAAPEDFDVEASPDLGQTTWVVADSVIEHLGNGEWQATVTETANRMFFRVTNNGVPITASFPTAFASAQEGDNNAIVVHFSEAFTGTLNYSIQISTELLTGQIEVNNAETVSIPIDIEDDAVVNPLEAITVRIEAASDGASYKIGSGSSQSLTVVDNDEFRAGILDSDDDIIDLPVRILITKQSGTIIAFLKSGTHGMIPANPGHPDGDWPFTTFALTPATLTGAVTVQVPAAETLYNAETEFVMTFEASGAENLADYLWNGTFTLATAVPSKSHLSTSRAGTFLLTKELPGLADSPPPTPIP